MEGLWIQYIIYLYMDFMKAFDKVPHKRLLGKLRSYGLSEQIIKWVEDFLSDRSQKVSVNNSESRDRPVTSGIPQGSVLGSILYVIHVYINAMTECVNASTYLFADDTKIYKEIVHCKWFTGRSRSTQKIVRHMVMATEISSKQV
jgi:hypothetical protein